MHFHQLEGRVVGFEPTIFWATTRCVNPYTIPAMGPLDLSTDTLLKQIWTGALPALLPDTYDAPIYFYARSHYYVRIRLWQTPK